MRLPLILPIESRDGTLTKGSKIVNGYAEVEGKPSVLSRNGLTLASSSYTEAGNGLYYPQNKKAVDGTGTIAYALSGNDFFSFTLANTTVPAFSGVSTNTFPSNIAALEIRYAGGGTVNGTTYIYGYSPVTAHRANLYGKVSWADSWTTLSTNVPYSFGFTFRAAFVFQNTLFLPFSTSSDANTWNFHSTSDFSTWGTAALVSGAGAFSGKSAIATAIHNGTVNFVVNNEYSYKSTNVTGDSWSETIRTGGTQLSTTPPSNANIESDGTNLYLFGGQLAGADQDVVYTSTDGVAWTVATSAPGWNPRYSAGSASDGAGYTIVVGGAGTSGAAQDIWGTPNGVTWAKLGNIPTASNLAASAAYSATEGFIIVWTGNSASASAAGGGQVANSTTVTKTGVVVDIGDVVNSNNVPADFASNEAGTSHILKLDNIAYTFT